MSRAQPTKQQVLSAAQMREEDLLTAAEFNADLPPELEFETVPRRPRADGLTPERQRIFIKMLSICGSVKTAAKAIGCTTPNMYDLRNSPGAESFCVAWDRAVERGARRVLDVLVDHAINGTPEYFYKDGELVGERRHFNTRAMMWIVAHNFPEQYGVTGGLMHSNSSPIGLKRLKQQWMAEGAAQAQPRIATEEELRRKVAETFDRLAEHREWMKRNGEVEEGGAWPANDIQEPGEQA